MSQVTRRLLPRSLPDQIAQWLIAEISEERLAPGQRITEQFVAEQCHVSRGPVRDAFRSVEKLGLIRLLPRRGAVVSPLDLNELKELFDIRAALTRVAVCRVIEQASDEQLENLISSARNLQSLVEDEQQFFAASNVISAEFFDLANSKKLGELMAPLQMQIMRYRHHGFSSPGARKASAKGFAKIAEAMMTRNKGQAAEVVESMTSKLQAEVEKAIEA